MQFSAETMPNNRLALPRRIGNPGSATGSTPPPGSTPFWVLVDRRIREVSQDVITSRLLTRFLTRRTSMSDISLIRVLSVEDKA